MKTVALLQYSMFTELAVSIGIFILMLSKGLLSRFGYLSAFLSVFIIETAISIATLFYRTTLGLGKALDYDIYFYCRWSSFFVLSALLLLTIYSVFRHAMKPLEGLHRAGKVIFRWVFGASLAVSMIVAVGPHAGTSTVYIQRISGQIQQATSVLTICLLLFVCFAIRHLGLTYRSHIFGISLGLGVFATVSLVESAWFSGVDAQNLYSPMYLYSAVGACIALLVWAAYFAIPEPERKMVLLPTTSPYFLWNRISEVLGDDPGDVVIAGFTPSMMAPEELQVLAVSARHARERGLEAAPTQAARQTAPDAPVLALQQ